MGYDIFVIGSTWPFTTSPSGVGGYNRRDRRVSGLDGLDDSKSILSRLGSSRGPRTVNDPYTPSPCCETNDPPRVYFFSSTTFKPDYATWFYLHAPKYLVHLLTDSRFGRARKTLPDSLSKRDITSNRITLVTRPRPSPRSSNLVQRFRAFPRIERETLCGVYTESCNSKRIAYRENDTINPSIKEHEKLYLCVFTPLTPVIDAVKRNAFDALSSPRTLLILLFLMRAPNRTTFYGVDRSQTRASRL